MTQQFQAFHPSGVQGDRDGEELTNHEPEMKRSPMEMTGKGDTLLNGLMEAS